MKDANKSDDGLVDEEVYVTLRCVCSQSCQSLSRTACEHRRKSSTVVNSVHQGKFSLFQWVMVEMLL